MGLEGVEDLVVGEGGIVKPQLIIRRAAAPQDVARAHAHGRQQLLILTPQGRAAAADLNARTQAAVGALLQQLPELQRRRLIGSAVRLAQIDQLTARPAGTGHTGIGPVGPGLLARALKPGNDRMGLIMTTLVGIAGAFVARYVGAALGLYTADEAAGWMR